MLGSIQGRVFNTSRVTKLDVDEYQAALCAEGYVGLLCGACDHQKGYGSRGNNRCVSCPSKAANIGALVGMALITLMVILVTIYGAMVSCGCAGGFVTR